MYNIRFLSNRNYLVLLVCIIMLLTGMYYPNRESTFGVPVISHIQLSNKVQLTDQEVEENIEQILNGNYEIIKVLSESELNQILTEMDKREIFPGLDEQEIAMVTALPDCGGYWTTYWKYEAIEHNGSSSGLKYETGPNCYMKAPGDDCGSDGDDYMLSFYFGRHDENIDELRSMLRWDSNNSWAEYLLWVSRHWVLDARVYEQYQGGDTDNYDIYICIPGKLKNYFSTFRLRKY